MAKRLTDTGKWNDDWFISLDNDYRIIWQWLLDNCDHAGVCKRSMKLLNMMCNTKISELEMVEKMEGRVIPVDNNWFIPKFLKFQYKTLHSDKPVIVSVVKELEKNNYTSLIPESFGNNYLIIKDKDKSKDKDSLNQKNKNGKSGNNFKAQGEELLAERYKRNLSQADDNGEKNN